MLKPFAAAKLKELIDYNPATGEFRWLERARSEFGSDAQWRYWNAKWAGRPALKNADSHGYAVGALMGARRQAHRVAWAYVHGAWPEHQIDHQNGNRQDNRIANLRQVTPAENNRNVKLKKSNSSGRVGVFWRESERRWEASIRVNHKRYPLGRHKTFEEACKARAAAELHFGFHPNHGAVRP